MNRKTKEAGAVAGAGAGGVLVGSLFEAMGHPVPIETATMIAAALGYVIKGVLGRFDSA